MLTRISIISVLSVGLCCVSSSDVFAQSGWGPKGPSKGEVVAAAAGAATVIGVVVYLAIPKQKTITGCVESSRQGLPFLQLRTDDGKHVYVLKGLHLSVEAGRRITVRGKLKRTLDMPTLDSMPMGTFEVKKIMEDRGPCS